MWSRRDTPHHQSLYASKMACIYTCPALSKQISGWSSRAIGLNTHFNKAWLVQFMCQAKMHSNSTISQQVCVYNYVHQGNTQALMRPSYLPLGSSYETYRLVQNLLLRPFLNSVIEQIESYIRNVWSMGACALGNG